MNKVLMKLPISERYQYIREVYFALNKNMGQSVQILHVSKNTIYNAIAIQCPTQRIYEKKLKNEHILYIHSRTITDPHISGETLAHEIYEFFGLKVTGRTINRCRNCLGLTFRPPIRSVCISQSASEKRFNFTKFHIENNTDFRKIVFTDESWFLLGRNKRWVWVDRYHITPEMLSNQQAHPPKVMIWGGIGFNFKTELVFIHGNLNSEEYIDQIILGSNLIEAADKTFGIGKWRLMQDNAHPHVSAETKSVLSELEIDVLS